MGRLTQDAARLRDEINAAHRARLILMQSTKENVASMKDDVKAMKKGFDSAHAERTRQGRAHRKVFLNSLKKDVARLRTETCADLTGARRAWIGNRPLSRVSR